MKKLLVIRFSAMGDVAISVPVIHSVLEQHPDIEITFLSRKFFKPIFNPHPRFTFLGIDLKDKKYEGILGMYWLYKELSLQNFDVVLDLHDVLRTKLLRFFFQIQRTPVFIIDKGRKEKTQALKTKIVTPPLKHSRERYADVFRNAGIKVNILDKAFLKIPKQEKITSFYHQINPDNCNKVIGFAPYSAHWSKELTPTQIKEVIQMLTQHPNYRIVLFGGGQKEKDKLEVLSSSYKNCYSVAGKFSLKEELFLLQNLDLMIAMDSSNMHLASIVGTKVLSIWCSTHPNLGFSPYQNEGNYIQVSQYILPCRPCSIYGKLKTKKDIECAKKSINMISLPAIIDKTEFLLSDQNG